MKNKNLTYLLLGVALLVWGWIFYQFFTALSDGPSVNLPKKTKIKVGDLQNLRTDTFQLLVNYKDPFFTQTPTQRHLGYWDDGSPRVNKPRKTVAPKKQPTPPVVIAPKIWPQLKLMGIILNKQSQKPVAILNLNGQENMVGKAGFVGPVKVLAIGKDSIALEFESEKKVLFKGQSIP